MVASRQARVGRCEKKKKSLFSDVFFVKLLISHRGVGRKAERDISSLRILYRKRPNMEMSFPKRARDAIT